MTHSCNMTQSRFMPNIYWTKIFNVKKSLRCDRFRLKNKSIQWHNGTEHKYNQKICLKLIWVMILFPVHHCMTTYSIECLCCYFTCKECHLFLIQKQSCVLLDMSGNANWIVKYVKEYESNQISVIQTDHMPCKPKWFTVVVMW